MKTNKKLVASAVCKIFCQKICSCGISLQYRDISLLTWIVLVIINLMLKYKLHYLSLVEIYFKPLTLFSFSWVLKVLNLFNPILLFNSIKMLRLSMKLTNNFFLKKKFSHEKKKLIKPNFFLTWKKKINKTKLKL